MTAFNINWDVVVVGAGAAGLMAAASAAGRGRKVLVLEKNRKLGVKILMSGGTRCNITHHCSPREIAKAFGPQGKFLHSALAELPPQEVVRQIEAEGVATKVETTGKIFPLSNRAVDVRDALVKIATNAGAKIETETPVLSIERIQEESKSGRSQKFSIATTSGCLTCESLIITTGGKSYPGCGTTGDGYGWAESLGHTLVQPVPALTPITCEQTWVRELKGVTLEDTLISVVESSDARANQLGTLKHALDSRRGSLLFTHFGFSGPAILDASRTVTRQASADSLFLICDFIPNQTRQEFLDKVRNRASGEGKLQIATALASWLPKRLAESLLSLANVAGETRLAELSKFQISEIADQLKRNRVPISGALGFKKAEVTAGGIELSEINSKDMQSKLVPGLFFAGEILDLDGPIGGFNFQAAFSTGWLAGLNA